MPFLGRSEDNYDSLKLITQSLGASDGIGSSVAGAGIVVNGNVIGISGNTILLYNSSGAVLSEYPVTEAGLTAAFAASSSGDIVLCPKQMPIACTSGVTIPAGVTLRGANLSFTSFSGTGITMSTGSALVDFFVSIVGSGSTARGILASGVACTLSNGDSFASNATNNIGLELSGADAAHTCNTTDVYGNASGGTSSIGARVGDFVDAKTTYADANAAATTNVGISFCATSAANARQFLSGWGRTTIAGGYGMQVEAGAWGRIIGGLAIGLAAGLYIGAGATALVYGLQWSSTLGSGTITYLPGDRNGTSGSMGGLGWFDVKDPLYGATGNGVTDDTTAIQAAINAAAAAGGGVVYFPKGVYIIGGALQDGSRGNAQLLLPAVDTTGEQIQITLLGETLPGMVPSFTGAIVTPHATTIKGTLNSGAGGALLGGWGPGGSYHDFTLINLRIENLAFQLPANPVFSALNLSNVESIDLVNVVVHTGVYQATSITQPTTTTSYGIITPKINNGAWTVLDGVLALGFYNGFQINEHTTATMISAMACVYAAEFPHGDHASHIARFLVQWSTNGLRFVGGIQHVIIDEFNVEHHNPTGAWYDSVYDIDDASNYGVGEIVYHVVISITALDDPIVVNGGANLHVISIHNAGAGSGGTVTSITASTGLTATPNPITGSGSIALNAALNDLSDVDTTGTGTGDIIYNNAGTWEDYPLGIGSRITVSGTKIRFGNVSGGNYLEIDSVTGTLRLVGDATTYDDFRVEASVVKPGATAPSWKAFGPSGNLQALMFEAAHDDEAYFEMQMPHNWKIGTNLYPHVHWTPTDATAGNVVWQLEYTWSNIGAAYGAPATMATDPTAAGGVAWVHKLTDFKSGGNNYIDGTGKTLSSMLICRVHRNSNSGSDTLNKDVALLEIDFHYQIDSLGSDEPLVKDASASLLLETNDILLIESGDRLLTE